MRWLGVLLVLLCPATAAAKDRLGLAPTSAKMHRTFALVQLRSRQLAADDATADGPLAMLCDEAAADGYDADRHAGAQAALSRGITLFSAVEKHELDQRDLYPGFAKHIRGAIPDAVDETDRSFLEGAAKLVEKARAARTAELRDHAGILLAYAAGLQPCTPPSTHLARDAARAAKAENAADRAVQQVGGYRAAHVAQPKPKSFAVRVIMTATFKSSEQLSTDTSCGEHGSELGSVTQAATLGPLTVNPDGTLADPGTILSPSSDVGDWAAQGTYYSEEQCNEPKDWTCTGPVQDADGSSQQAGLLAVGTNVLTLVSVSLPQVVEGNVDSCPNASDVEAPVPLETEAGPVADHAEDLLLPVSGLAYRGGYDGGRITTGIEPAGDPLPPADCGQTGEFTCSTAGSGTKVMAQLIPR